MTFDEKDYAALLQRLEALSDEKYRKFNLSLIPGATCSYGVRVPQLREIAKELAAGDWRSYIAVAKTDTHTERMLQGLVIAYAKCDYAEKLDYVEHFLPVINNWAVCDTFASTLKEARKHHAETWDFIMRHLNSQKEYELRFCAVLLMDYFIDAAHIDRILQIYGDIHHDGYYVKMAVAWGLSFCYIAFREETLALLTSDKLDEFTFKKTIQKLCESYRVSDADKQMLKNLKQSRYDY